MKLILVRHGETDANNRDLLQGQMDCPLNERGRLQAVALAEGLKGETLDVVYCSDLKRSRETAEIIARIHERPVRIMKEARERNFGIFEGTSRAEFYTYERSLPDPYRHKPEKGESFAELYERAHCLLKVVCRRHTGGIVLLISHGDFARMCLGVLTGKPVQEACQIRQSNSCINILNIHGDLQAEPLVLNQISHLPESLLSHNGSEL
ncbi:MAG: histidine phosphatase family protein [Deltaproteobacteria bacterium]|nr:histidine phosphatase family protein [Deltaproteobacteria bacterium]MBI2501033.1 histidine phosphatase family protein [Deltaproteobacteria bacterium]